LYTKLNVAASGQSHMIVDIRGKNQNVLLSTSKSIPFSANKGSNKNFIELWKVKRTNFLKSLDFFSDLSFAFKIGRYPSNRLASDLLRLLVEIFPIDI